MFGFGASYKFTALTVLSFAVSGSSVPVSTLFEVSDTYSLCLPFSDMCVSDRFTTFSGAVVAFVGRHVASMECLFVSGLWLLPVSGGDIALKVFVELVT